MILSSSYAADDGGDIGLNPSDVGVFKNITENRTSGSTITLSSGQTYGLNKDNVDIKIVNSITIKSSDSSQNAIINCNKWGHAFVISPGGNLTLINITIINAMGLTHYGGAISNDGGTVNLTGCNFTNNEGGDGGAIHTRDGGTATLTGCTFTNNIATGNSGGAIYNLGSRTSLTDCIFEGNLAVNWGGAIFNEGTLYGAILTVDNCTFINNKVDADGGAIHNDGGSVFLTSCNFTGNQANGYGGGAVSNRGGSTISTDCNFTSNTARDGGGAIYCSGGTFNANNCNFTSNTATKDGGAIYYIYTSKLTLINCTFSQNKANTKDGGAICADSGSATLTANNCTFINNLATNSGGAIYNGGSSTSLTDCSFTNNKANVEGGAISNMGMGTLNVIKCNFTNNTATNGGAIYKDGEDVSFTDCNFINNTATHSYFESLGGAICNRYGGDVTLTSCNFTGNTATNSGGAIYNTGSSSLKLITNTCNFINNKANNGGAISNIGYTTFIAHSCIFTGNTATNSGGAVYNTAISTLTNCNFTNNRAPSGDYNGGIYNSSELSLINCFVDGVSTNLKTPPTQLNYNQLLSEINSASSLSGFKYTTTSWNVFKAALANARNMNNVKNAKTQGEIDNIIKALSTAKSKLVILNVDLKITKILRSGNNYKVTIKNLGKDTSGKTSLKIWYKVGKKTYYKTVNVKAIKGAKTQIVTVKFFKFSTHKKITKTAHINHNQLAYEKNYKNNQFTIKKG